MMRIAALLLVLAAPAMALGMNGGALAGRLLMAVGLPSVAAPILADPAARGAAFYAAERWEDAAAAFGRDAALSYDRGNALAHAGRFVDAIQAYDLAITLHPDDADARHNRTLVTTLAFAAQSLPAVSGGADGDRLRRPPQGGRVGSLTETAGTADGHGAAAGAEGAASSGTQGSGKVDRFSGNDATSAPAPAAPGLGSAGAGEGPGRTGDVMAGVARQVAARNRRMPRMLESGSVEPSAAWLESLPDDPGRFLRLRLRAEQARRRLQAASRNEDPD